MLIQSSAVAESPLRACPPRPGQLPPVTTLPGSAVGAGFAVTWGAYEFGPELGRLGEGGLVFASTPELDGAVGVEGDSLVEQPAVSPIPTTDSAPTIKATCRVRSERSFFTSRL